MLPHALALDPEGGSERGLTTARLPAPAAGSAEAPPAAAADGLDNGRFCSLPLVLPLPLPLALPLPPEPARCGVEGAVDVAAAAAAA